MANPPPTLAGIAQAAGVSVSTVSRALHHTGRISPSTVRRIHAIAEALGYRPNPYVTTLMSHMRQGRRLPFRGSLAYLDLYPGESEWRRYQVAGEFRVGARAQADLLGYSLAFLHVASVARDASQLTRLMLSRGIDGVVFGSRPHYDQQTATLPFDISRFAVASIGTRYFGPDLHFSTGDQFASTRLAFAELRKLGYSRIGYVNRVPIEQIVQHRFLGGFLAAGHLEPSSSVTPLVTKDYSDFRDWFRANKPDAVVSIETTALGIMREMSVDVPGRVAFAHLNCQDDDSGTAGVVQNNDKVAAAAVELVVNQISHNQRGAPAAAKGVLVEGRWKPGVTVPPVRGR